MKRAGYDDPHYAVFSSFPPLPVWSKHSNFFTSSVYVLFAEIYSQLSVNIC